MVFRSPARYNDFMVVYESKSEQDTIRVAKELARNAKLGDVFLLNGTLGAGKSVFARGFIRALCGTETEVPSPTFTLVQTYDAGSVRIWHFDLYRLQDPDEIFEIGWEDALSDGISLIEWAEKAGHYKPKDATRIDIEILENDERRITVT